MTSYRRHRFVCRKKKFRKADPICEKTLAIASVLCYTYIKYKSYQEWRRDRLDETTATCLQIRGKVLIPRDEKRFVSGIAEIFL